MTSDDAAVEPSSHRISLGDWERDAHVAMSLAAHDYILAGAMDERTIGANDTAWQAHWLRPRVIPTSWPSTGPSLQVEVLGRTWAHPVFAAPTANHAMVHADSEEATARALHATSTTMTVSTSASRAMADVTRWLDDWWFQAYLPTNERLRHALLDQAVQAGAEAIVLTVDLPVGGQREAPLRAGRAGVPEERSRFLWAEAARAAGFDEVPPVDFVQPVTLGDLEWVVGRGLPVVVKGVLRGDDARRAVDVGVAAVQVSNHGGRQLDGAIPSAVALPDVVAAVGGEVPVLVDGGIRRGADVVTALALGATAVAVGKPVIWGLAVDGQDGVTAVVDTLVAEVAHVMLQAGCATVADITPDLLGPATRG